MDFGAQVEVDAGAAARIAEGMARVAGADGAIHPREMALIEGFRAEIPEGTEPAASPLPAGVGELYVRSLLMVGMADGRVSEVEGTLILKLAAEQGIDAAAVRAMSREVARHLFGALGSVQVFADEALGLAHALGLDEAEARELIGG
jgi:hypothetical protein